MCFLEWVRQNQSVHVLKVKLDSLEVKSWGPLFVLEKMHKTKWGCVLRLSQSSGPQPLSARVSPIRKNKTCAPPSQLWKGILWHFLVQILNSWESGVPLKISYVPLVVRVPQVSNHCLRGLKFFGLVTPQLNKYNNWLSAGLFKQKFSSWLIWKKKLNGIHISFCQKCSLKIAFSETWFSSELKLQFGLRIFTDAFI